MLGAPYGLAVDSQVVQLVDLTAGLEAEPLLEIPTREILDAYALGLAAERVSEHFLILLVDSWLRNVMQPLPSSTVPGLDRIRSLGLAACLDEGRVVTEWRGLYSILYVETHWIMGCVLHQEAEAPRLLEPLAPGSRVAVPAFCIAEAIARFRTIDIEARTFREKLTANRREATRMDLARRLQARGGAGDGHPGARPAQPDTSAGARRVHGGAVRLARRDAPFERGLDPPRERLRLRDDRSRGATRRC